MQEKCRTNREKCPNSLDRKSRSLRQPLGVDQLSIIRHDPVTARAISRLSHGIARLSPGFGGSNNRERYIRSIQSSENPVTCKSPDANRKSQFTTGSKRKWEADKMDLDVGTNRVRPYSINFPVTTTADISALNLQSPFISISKNTSTIVHRSMSSDNLVYSGHYSSESSMLSVTSSSDHLESDVSSHRHDADVEDEDDESHVRYKLIKSSRRRSGQDKYVNDLSYKLTECNSGGDSSDGLAANLKVPRLHSCYPHTNIFPKLRLKKHSALSHSLEDIEMALNNSPGSNFAFRSRHKHRHGQKYCTSENNTSTKYLFKNSILKTSMNSSNASTVSSEDSSEVKSSKNRKYHRHKSSRQLSGSGVLYKSKHGVSGGCTSSTFDHNCATEPNLSFQRLAFGEDSVSIGDVDPELRALLIDTWPLLSARAKSDFVKDVNLSTAKRYDFSAVDHSIVRKSKNEPAQSLSRTNCNLIKFIPPTGADTQSTANTSDVANLRTSTDRTNRMPTPPWSKSDNESENSEGIYRLYQFQTDKNHPGLGHWKPHLSNASPINEVNVGHKLLRKLGWNPGNGVGHGAQGILTPIGCETKYSGQTL